MASPREPGFELTNDGVSSGALVREVWRARSLIGLLARKDFYVRYRRASFGLVWAVVLPLLQAVVLAFVLSRFVRFDTVNYPVFVFSGTVAWSFFAGSAATASTSIVDGANLSTKIYFPRAVLPLVAVGANVYGLILGVGVLILMAVVSSVDAQLRLLLLAPAIVLAVVFTGALSLLLSALHVYFRDVRYIVQAALLVWFYVTPVIYPLNVSPGLARWLPLNPMTGIVELFRAAVVGGDPGWVGSLWWSVGWTFVLLVGAVALHRRYDRVFVDLL